MAIYIINAEQTVLEGWDEKARRAPQRPRWDDKGTCRTSIKLPREEQNE